MTVPWSVIAVQCLLAFLSALAGSFLGERLARKWRWRTAYARGRIDAFKAVYEWHGQLAAAAQLGPRALRDEMARLQAQFAPHEKGDPS